MADASDDDTFTFIPPQIRLTPFDRRLRELRELQERYEELARQPNKERRLAELKYQIREAKKRFEEEKRRDGDENWRRRRDVDSWRSGEGRELRNSSRRKVRDKPNEDLSHMTDEQKEERKRDQRADGNFVKRREAKGVAVANIQAELIVRQQQRNSMRQAALETENPMTSDPYFGMF
ncbi:hypothetical protein [Aliirhizobium smilacinae]|uniref:Uncharacterized protein n=1 Tax=Aliirhizobium smilacinae TaxID=1395944 RepID=A0A5C4XAU9_9HYPH|nr:hypothetical protein [Rhizobium smilacinae]TNM60547.1 hypothetical protein FHP24_25235 [Rhizobium smilacinae]